MLIIDWSITISVVLCQSVNQIPRGNHWPVTCNWQTLS